MEGYFDHIRQVYDSIAVQYLERRNNMHLHAELERFVNLVGSGSTVLDAGCGPGRDAQYLVNAGQIVTGIDISSEQIRLAQQRVQQAKFAVMNVIDLRFDDETYDGVWCCAVLSHVRRCDFTIALKEFHRVLRPNGVLFLSVKNGGGEQMVIESEFPDYTRFTVFYSITDVTELLQMAGFQILTTYLFNERERFGRNHRDIDFLLSFSRKPHFEGA